MSLTGTPQVQRVAQECPSQGWGFSIPRHRLEQTPLTKLMFSARACCADPTIPLVCRTCSSSVTNPTPPGSTGGLPCSVHSEVPAPEPQTNAAPQEMNTAPQSSVLQHQQCQFWRLDLAGGPGRCHRCLMCIPVEAGGSVALSTPWEAAGQREAPEHPSEEQSSISA